MWSLLEQICWSVKLKCHLIGGNGKYNMANIKERYFNICTSEIVCPYCGYEISDSWELTCDDDEYECDECGKKFHYYREVDVHYTTHRISDDGKVDYWDDLIKEEQTKNKAGV